LLVDVVPWLDLAGRQFFSGLGLPPPEAAFLAYFAIQGLSGLGMIIAIWLVVHIEQPIDWKAFFTLDRVDWRGFWMVIVISGLLLALDGWFLGSLVWEPIQSWLMNLGLWTGPSVPIAPHAYRWLNLIVLLLVVWIEIPEELYFRGYLQRQITARRGAFWGITLSLLLWNLWHLNNPAAFVRRFFAGLLSFALVVHKRGRVWGSMLGHPVSNRLGVILRLSRS
jgi:membrane protease YdiL (CAAX protease family)